MCISIPGKVIEIKENRFVISYPDEKRVVNLNIVDNLKVGDYVIISNKIIIAKIPREDAEKFFELINF